MSATSATENGSPSFPPSCTTPTSAPRSGAWLARSATPPAPTGAPGTCAGPLAAPARSVHPVARPSAGPAGPSAAGSPCPGFRTASARDGGPAHLPEHGRVPPDVPAEPVLGPPGSGDERCRRRPVDRRDRQVRSVGPPKVTWHTGQPARSPVKLTLQAPENRVQRRGTP